MLSSLFYPLSVKAETTYELTMSRLQKVHFSQKSTSEELLIAQGEQQCLIDLFGISLGCRPVEKTTGSSRTGSAGKQGACSNLMPMALIPQVSSNFSEMTPSNFIEGLINFTADQSSTFWFYVPEISSPDIKLAELVILSEDKKVSETFFHLIKTAGIVSLTLPLKEARSLQSNQIYHWFFSIICDARRPSRNSSVDGWIKIKNEPKDYELIGITERRKFEIYAKNNVWHDLLTTLIQSHCNKTSDLVLKKHWFNFMEWLKRDGINEDKWNSYCKEQSERQLQEIS
jgi:Domain of Unknown Function (DUF928)